MTSSSDIVADGKINHSKSNYYKMINEIGCLKTRINAQVKSEFYHNLIIKVFSSGLGKKMKSNLNKNKTQNIPGIHWCF